jgi:4a-hydroxytetrahydrobiopterin dehydratase
MTELARERCQACSGDTPTISGPGAADLAAQLDPAWKLEGDRLRRHFQLPDFARPFSLATRIALLAEREGHHPELSIGWGHLEVELTTHAAGGLTRNDFVMAAKIDRMEKPTK